MYNAIIQKAPAILEKLERISPNCSKQLQELISDPLAYESEQPDSARPSPNLDFESGASENSPDHLRKVNAEQEDYIQKLET
jgi:hypothetical protein